MENTDKRVPNVEQWKALGEVINNAGGVKELTSADYNYPEANPDKVAAWLLDDGVYSFASDTVAANTYYEKTNDAPGNNAFVSHFTVVTNPTSATKTIEGVYHSPAATRYSGFTVMADATTGARAANGFAWNLTNASVEQSTGTNTSRPMSQNATTSMVFADPIARQRVRIGVNSSSTGARATAVGVSASAETARATALGDGARAGAYNSVAVGRGSLATHQGQMDIGDHNSEGYNGSSYRLLTGLYDPQSDHDAATKGYVDNLVGDIDVALQTILNGEES